MRVKWTDRKEFLLIVEYPVTPDTRALAEAIGVSYSGLKCRAVVLKLSREGARTGRATDSLKERRFVHKHYLSMGSKTMATKLGRSDVFIRGLMKREGLVVPEEVKRKFIEESKMKPGHVSWNKGKRLSEYATPKMLKGMRKNQFKKGQLPKNTLHDGAITIRKDSHGRPYKFIRTGLAKWELYHRYVWEKKHGKIPSGSMIRFKDGDSLNVKLSNLECITRQENARRNSHWGRWPRELSEAILIGAHLSRRIKLSEKKLQDAKEQNRRSEKSHVRTAGKARRRNAQKRGIRKRDPQSKSHERYRKGYRGKRKNRAASR